MKKLVIVESPTKAKTISQFLGPDFIVESSFGHIRDLPQRKLGVDVDNNFAPEYVVPAKAAARVSRLKKLAQKTEQIILATDEDREGEAISWHLTKALRLPKAKSVQRIVFHEITKSAIKKALAKPRQLDLNLVDAQQARRILDRLVGYKLSPFLWKKVVKGLSAGRVQSVAVRLIADREKQIKAFKPQEYWSLTALLATQQSHEQFKADLINKDKFAVKNKQTAEEIKQAVQAAIFTIADIATKQTQRHALPPFATSTLQQAAANRLGFSAKQTMRLAQQLYEGIKLTKSTKGLITYMRTDSLHISKIAQSQAGELIKQKYGDKYLGLRVFKTKSKGAQEAHEAIRPTSPKRTPISVKKYLDPSQFKLYQLIWQRFIASQMSPALLDTAKVDIQADKYLFRANGAQLKFDGWTKIYPVQLTENILPALKPKEILDLKKLLPEQHFTQPPARYGEATLIKALEKQGIGRPSTYAPIISTIQTRNYVLKNDQKKFEPTEIGLMVTDILTKHFPAIVDIKFTARMEDDLDDIARGKRKWVPVLKEFYAPFAKNLKEKYAQVKKQNTDVKTDKICPNCGTNLVIKLGRFGKFYACPKFPACKHTEPIVNSTGVKCPKCAQGQIIEKRTKRGKTFYACNQWPKCDFALWQKPTGNKCPHCQSLMITARNNKEICSNKICPGKDIA